jgi:N-acylneuraminate cytidylyltransferase
VTEVLALIPARGGSKGIPRKNVRLVAGKPLIAYSIDHALQARRITRTIVSTDDAEIAEVARAHGAEVPFLRPPELAEDESPDLEAFLHALDWLRDKEGYEPELVVHLRPTCPVRRSETIDAAIAALVDDPSADSLRSVSPPHQTPYKMWRIADGYLEPLLTVPGIAEPYNEPRQALPATWSHNGYVDVIRTSCLREQRSMTGRRILGFEMVEQVADVDYEEDIAAAERLLAQQDSSAGEGRETAVS